MNSIGAMYRNGQGVTTDYMEAARWYRRAADLGNQAAMYNLGSLYQQGLGVPMDPEEARKWFAMASRNGQDDAGQ